MSYNDNVVDVSVTLGTQPIDTVGFETPLFVGIHNVFKERARVYADLEQLVDDGFAPGSAVHKFAAKAFSGLFPPSYIIVGRQSLKNVEIDFTGKTNIDPENPVTINVVSGDYTKAIIVNVTGSSNATTIAKDVKDQLAADITLAEVLTATVEAGKVTVTPKEGKAFSIGKDYGNYTLKNVTDETVALVMPEIEAAQSNWYFLATEQHTEAAILAAAEYAAANYKLHIYSTNDEACKAERGESIAAKLKAKQYDTSGGMYDPDADVEFPEGGIIGAMASNDPSYGDSLHLKTMDGVVAPALTIGERMAIWGQNLNFYRMINGVGAFWEGKCASGQYLDVIRFAHWIKFRSEESVFGYMSRRSNMGLSMKMSDDDLPVLKSVLMNSPINTGIENGAILTGFDSENEKFYDPVITIPKRGSIPTNELAARELNGVKVELVYNNALHFVKIRINVLLDGTSAGASTTAGV